MPVHQGYNTLCQKSAFHTCGTSIPCLHRSPQIWAGPAGLRLALGDCAGQGAASIFSWRKARTGRTAETGYELCALAPGELKEGGRRNQATVAVAKCRPSDRKLKIDGPRGAPVGRQRSPLRTGRLGLASRAQYR